LPGAAGVDGERAATVHHDLPRRVVARQRSRLRDAERAAADRRPAGVTVGPAEHERTRARLRQRPAAADRPGEAEG
jgi:hypothetical protein